MKIDWNMSGSEIERESFNRIEREIGDHGFITSEWRVIRRIIHTTADFSIAENICFYGDPINVGIKALRDGALIYSDSNMIRSGISIPKLKTFNSSYTKESIMCKVADEEVIAEAKTRGVARSVVALEKMIPLLDGSIILIGNAPLALAIVAREIKKGSFTPGLVIGMPVGFVHVVESKEMIMDTNIPQIVLKGRRGGSPLAVATLHAIMETEK